jgi:rubredoxin
MCVVCGYVYEEAEGRPEDGIAPGTAWADVPADWMCPECNVGKVQFQMVEI